MTTTTVAKQALTPDAGEIDEFCQHLAGRRDSLYAFVAGYLISLVQGVASDHRCRKPDCMTCNRLRRGLALIAAIDAIEGDDLTGDPS